MNYKVCLIGTKDTTLKAAEFILKKIGYIDCIITIDEQKINTQQISGFFSLEEFANQHNIELFKVENYSMKDEKSQAFFTNNTFEIAICMGWQRLIPEYVLNRFVYGIFGFHGSCGYLPYGRGRSPLNWSVINGDQRFILNLFKYDAGVDSPNVYQNRIFEISPHDDIRTLQYKNLLVSFEMMGNLLNDYFKGTIKIKTESKDFDSLYSKRTPQDGKINFHEKTRNIYNLIRGVTNPFPGAFCFIKGKKERILIWKAIPFDCIIDFSNYEVGEIIEVFDDKPIVRTIDGSLLIEKYESTLEIKKHDILQ